jgi:hypothetical protein
MGVGRLQGIRVTPAPPWKINCSGMLSMLYTPNLNQQKRERIMANQSGRCVCGAVAYQVNKDPLRVTMCHCRFCQRATGGAYMVEPVFDRADFAISRGTPATYDHVSEGSGKTVTIHFCATCGTKLFLGFERFADVIGIYGGTFDDPGWFDRSAQTTKHIFLDVAQKGTVIPAGLNTFGQHATDNDGNPIPPQVFASHHLIV